MQTMKFIKRSFMFLLLSFFTFFASILSDDWFVDHTAPIVLMIFSISSFIYVFFNGIINIFKTNKTFVKTDVILPFLPLLLAILIFWMQTKDLEAIEFFLLETTANITSCGEVVLCDIPFKTVPFDNGIKVKFTKGITTVDVQYFFLGNCLNVSPSYSILRSRHYKYCRENDKKELN